jgi:hypothetical protein
MDKVFGKIDKDIHEGLDLSGLFMFYVSKVLGGDDGKANIPRKEDVEG